MPRTYVNYIVIIKSITLKIKKICFSIFQPKTLTNGAVTSLTVIIIVIIIIVVVIIIIVVIISFYSFLTGSS